jgi:hypothetical protein
MANTKQKVKGAIDRGAAKAKSATDKTVNKTRAMPRAAGRNQGVRPEDQGSGQGKDEGSASGIALAAASGPLAAARPARDCLRQPPRP